MAKKLRSNEKVQHLTDKEELRKRGYILGASIGHGSFAKVKMAFSENHNRNVAIKIIDKNRAPDDFKDKFLPRELEVLQRISHPHIIKFHEQFEIAFKLYIVMDLAGHGDLLEYIKLRGAIPEERAKVMFKQIADAVHYLHENNIIHRDLKCENILLDEKNNVKLSDFGFARHVEKGQYVDTFCGSAAYAAPEILMGRPYRGESYDVWSMGVVLYCMVIGYMPFDDTNLRKMVKHQTQKKISFPRRKKVSKEGKELILSMLEPTAKKRITVNNILNSEWITGKKEDKCE